MREDLITLKQARSAQPCSTGWKKFRKALGEPAKFNPDRLFSIGDVAVSNGLADALWCLRLLPPRLAVMTVMPAVKRAVVHTTDTRVHETINAVQRWIDGDTTVDLRSARASALAAADAAADAAAWAAQAARAAAACAVYASMAARAPAAGAARQAADAAAWAAAGAARVAERDAQLQVILSLFPPHALA